jgi:hypothetical protein
VGGRGVVDVDFDVRGEEGVVVGVVVKERLSKERKRRRRKKNNVKMGHRIN